MAAQGAGDLREPRSSKPVPAVDIIYYDLDTEPGSPAVTAHPDTALVLLGCVHSAPCLRSPDPQVVLRTFNAPVSASASSLKDEYESSPHGPKNTIPNSATWDSKALVDYFETNMSPPSFLSADILADENSTVDLNRLCGYCQKACSVSRVLNHRVHDEDPAMPDFEPTEESHGRMFTKHLRESFEFHPSGASLLSSALQGCHLCTIVCDELFAEVVCRLRSSCFPKYACLPLSPPRLVLEWSWWHRSLEPDQGPASSRRISLEFRDGISKKLKLFKVKGLDVEANTSGGETQDEQTTLHRHQSAVEESLRTGHLLSTSTGSDAVFVLAKRWISECCQHHASCRDAVGTSRFRPTRLVDVGPPDGSQQLRLSLKTGDDSAVQYLALSYCWGTSNVYKLTSNTAGEMSRGFPASKLPQTLQDAVNACRKLKQRYIWIDSLCIFQDSEVDWRQEAAQMGLVYTHALCTIAAVCARDSSEGFFSRRNPRVRQPCSFPTKIKISTCRLFSRLHYHKIQPKQPLYSRAWVLQERVLSPRILKFGLEAVSWECSESLLYEAKQTKPPYYDSPSRIDFKQICRARNIARDRDSQSAFWLWWKTMIQKYTCMDLTRPRDRVAAFYGVLSDFRNKTGTAFFDGLPVDCFLPSLLWVARAGSGRRLSYSMKPSEQRLCTSSMVNTLSWASVEAVLEYSYHSCFYSRDASNVIIWEAAACMEDALQTEKEERKKSQTSRWLRLSTQRLWGKGLPGSHRPSEAPGLAHTIHPKSTAPDALVMYEREQNIDITVPKTVSEYATPGPMNSRIIWGHRADEYRYTSRLMELRPSFWTHNAPSQVIIEGPTLAFTTECTAQNLSSMLHCSYWSHPLYERGDSAGPHVWFLPDLVDLRLAPVGWKIDVLCLTIMEWRSTTSSLVQISQPEAAEVPAEIGDWVPDHAAGLVLVKGPDAHGDVYTRVGYFELTSPPLGIGGNEYVRAREAAKMRRVAII